MQEQIAGGRSFATATAVQRVDGTTYRAVIAEGWDIAGNANGGYLLAVAAAAVTDATGKPDVVSITSHYLRPGKPGPAAITVTPHRIGRRHATATAVLGEPDDPILVVVATTTDLSGAAGLERVGADPPDLPDPDDCVSHRPENSQVPLPFMDKVELRLHPEDAGFREGHASGEPRVRGWFRLPGGEALTTSALLLAVDAFPPTIFNADLPVAWTPTVELTAHVRRVPPSEPGVWLRCVFTTRFIAGGYLEEDGELWDETGALVAQSRQLALVPRAP